MWLICIFKNKIGNVKTTTNDIFIVVCLFARSKSAACCLIPA